MIEPSKQNIKITHGSPKDETREFYTEKRESSGARTEELDIKANQLTYLGIFSSTLVAWNTLNSIVHIDILFKKQHKMSFSLKLA